MGYRVKLHSATLLEQTISGTFIHQQTALDSWDTVTKILCGDGAEYTDSGHGVFSFIYLYHSTSVLLYPEPYIIYM